MSTVHLISGLGADQNAFSGLGDFTHLNINFVQWIPNLKDESLQNYVTRLIKIHKIEETDLLIGLSFGGLVALEIAKNLNLEKVILISSFRDKQDLKPIFENLLRLNFHKLIPNLKFGIVNSFIRSLFNTTSDEGRKVLNEMLNKTDVVLTKWSIQKIDESHFESRKRTRTKVYNIIGDGDKLVKLWINKDTYVIKNGGHFMIFENSNEITRKLKLILGDPNTK